MAIQAATYTYNTVGIREDLSDLISNITPTETKFSNMCRKGKISNTFFEWQMDALASPANNAQLEGDATPAPVFTATTRAGNRAQIAVKSVSVSGTEQAVDKAGRGKDELAYQLTKKTKEIKRDVEYSLLTNNVFNAGNSTTARQTMGLVGFIDGGGSLGGQVISTGTGGNQPAFTANTARTAATAAWAAVTEANILTVLQNTYIAGGDPDTLMTDAKTKSTISSWTSGTTKYTEAVDKKLVNTISVYESDYGVQKVVANRILPTTTNGKVVYALDSSGFELAFLRPYQVSDKPVDADALKKVITVEFGLKVDNNLSHGAVRDIL